jgi:ElaB/YqjD/DUF883 family membrane-anchored ribosome-binding protein
MSSQDTKAELDKTLAKLGELRDELRVKVHLASLDAKDEWRKLEDRVQHVVDEAKREATDMSRKAATEAMKALEKFRASLS